MMKKLNLFLVFGQLLAMLGLVGFLVNRYILGNNGTVALISGVFLGLSIVLNIKYLLSIRKNLKPKNNMESITDE